MLKSRVRIPKNVVASNNTHPTVEATAEKDHPRELVAQIAATLQKPDEPEAVTVERALKLLDATAQALAARAKARDQQAAVPEWLSFNDGLKWLTKQRRLDRARFARGQVRALPPGTNRQFSSRSQNPMGRWRPHPNF